MVNEKNAQEFTQALGQVFEGAVRLADVGIDLKVPETLGLSPAEWIQQRIAGPVQLVRDQRRLVVEANPDKTTRELGEALGVTHTTIENDRHTLAGKKLPTAQPSSGKKLPTSNGDKAAAAEETKLRREASRNADELADAFELRFGDAREVLADVPASSTPLILTDPPYGDTAEPLYQWLAEWAARTLMPGGSLIVYTGQSRLDRDMAIFSDKLRYWWLLTMLHTQVQSLPGKFVRAEFKPVLWYVKEHRRGRTLVSDVLRPVAPDKTEHKWGQGEAGVQFLIENLTAPGEKILDPFAGTATWGRIAISMGRRWLGAEAVADASARSDGQVIV